MTTKKKKKKIKKKKKGLLLIFVPFPLQILHFFLLLLQFFFFSSPFSVFFLASFFLVTQHKFPGEKYQGALWPPCPPPPSPTCYATDRAPIGGIQVFLKILITVIRQMHMYCGRSVKINMRETLHGARRSWTHFVCFCSRVCGQQKPEY